MLNFSLSKNYVYKRVSSYSDADYMGESNCLIDNFKAENIIITSRKIIHLEKELIKIRKDVTKGYEVLQISCGDFELIQLNEEYQSENTGSQIFYATNEFFKAMTREDIKDWANTCMEFVYKDLGYTKEQILRATVHLVVA